MTNIPLYVYMCMYLLVQLSHSVVTPWTAARQASLSITNSRSLLTLMSIELVMPSNHLIFCRPLLLLPSTFPSIRVFSMSRLFIHTPHLLFLFIHRWTLTCLHLLAALNNAAMSMNCWYLFEILFPCLLDKYPRPQAFYRWKSRLQAESGPCQGPSGAGQPWWKPASSHSPVIQACCVMPAGLRALPVALWGRVVSRSSPALCFASLAASRVLPSSRPPSARQEVILSLPKGQMNQRVDQQGEKGSTPAGFVTPVCLE